MSPWLVPGSPVYRCRIYGKDWGRVVSTGMRDRDGAREVEAFAERLYGRRRWDILDAIKAKQMTLADAFDADRLGKLEDVLRTINDVDLDPLVTEWAKGANAKYAVQVRRLIPQGARFPRSAFTKAAVSAFLATLNVTGPTKNRYRAALSVFARWLVERDVLEHNPVREVRGFKEHDPRDQWMTWENAQKVAERAEEPYRTLFLLMAGTGLEWGAVARLRVADIDLKAETIHARGSKTRWRNRVVRVQPWAWSALKDLVRGMVGNARVFDGLVEWDALLALKTACVAMKFEPHRIHDLRHTYAVNALRAGMRPEVVAHQLGHKDATLVQKVYGRYVPTIEDYLLHGPAQATSRKTGGRK